MILAAQSSSSWAASIELGLLFGVAFLASRVLLRVGAHRWLVDRLATGARSGLGLCVRLMAITALISSVVPNVITVLAMLPVIQSAVAGLPEDRRNRALTACGLGVVYGASIGSIMTVVGSPANGLLLGVLAYRDVVGHELITAWRWSMVGIPFAAVFFAVAAGILAVMERQALNFDPRAAGLGPSDCDSRDLRRAALVVLLAPLGAVLLSALDVHWSGRAIASAGWIGLLAVVPLPSGRGAVLRPRDVVSGIPWRGLALVLGAIAFGVALDRLGAVAAAVNWLAAHIPVLGETAATFGLVLLTIFLTEVLSNTATALAMWPLAEAVAAAGQFPALPVMVAIGIGANCAFMSPVGTGSTAMAFGGLPGLRFRRMVITGAVVNVAGGLLIGATALLLG